MSILCLSRNSCVITWKNRWYISKLYSKFDDPIYSYIYISYSLPRERPRPPASCIRIEGEHFIPVRYNCALLLIKIMFCLFVFRCWDHLVRPFAVANALGALLHRHHRRPFLGVRVLWWNRSCWLKFPFLGEFKLHRWRWWNDKFLLKQESICSDRWLKMSGGKHLVGADADDEDGVFDPENLLGLKKFKEKKKIII